MIKKIAFEQHRLLPEQRYDLIRLANHFDKRGLVKEANYIDAVLKKEAFLDSAASSIGRFFGSYIDNIQGSIVRYILDAIGFQPKGLGAEFVANLVENFDVDEIITLIFNMDNEERCKKVTEEVTNAFQKSLVEINILDKIEKVFVDGVSSVLGVDPDGIFMKFIGADTDAIKEMVSTMLTDQNIISVQISELICATLEAILNYVAQAFPQIAGVLGIDPSDAAAANPLPGFDVGGLFSGLTDGLSDLLESGVDFVGDLVSGGSDFVGDLVDQGSDLVGGLLERGGEVVDDATGAIQDRALRSGGRAFLEQSVPGGGQIADLIGL